MAIVSDDWHAVNTDTVSSVTKPDSDTVLYLVIYADGCPPVTFWFADVASRDDFYKKIVDGMGAA